jgi:EAL and modified HD-GYP domain-containing signal transduction protein
LSEIFCAMLSPVADGPLTLVARQPILEVSGVVHAHELLFRGGADAMVGGGERATASVLVSTFLDTRLDEVTAGKPAWVNVSRDFLLAVDPLPMPPERVVLELLEDQLVDGPLLDRLAGLRRDGYAIAADDFVWRPGVDALLDHVTHVKLDMRALGVEGFGEQVDLVAGRALVVLAEKVETAAEAAATVALGATLLQGFHFARPESVPGRPLTGSRRAAVRSAVTLCASADFDEVERALRSDPALSLRVLNFLNSAASPTTHRVSSIRQALVLVGPRTVAQWAATLLLSDLAEHRRATLAAALLRAALCERLAGPARDAGFVVGMLSARDALVGAPLPEILGGLPLDDAVSAAVLSHAGPLGDTLAAAIRIAEGAGAATPDEADALRDALVWADGALPPRG